MDKNPDGVLACFPNHVNSVLCHDAFAKEAAIGRIIGACTDPVMLLDFDQLFTGYVNSEMVPRGDNLRIYSPDRQNWVGTFKELATRASSQQTVLIVDSLNGFFSVFDERDSGMYANSCMMMLSSSIRAAGGKIFLCSVARLREGEGWILHPTGRHVLDSGLISKFFVRRQNGIQLEALSRENSTEKVFCL